MCYRCAFNEVSPIKICYTLIFLDVLLGYQLYHFNVTPCQLIIIIQHAFKGVIAATRVYSTNQPRYTGRIGNCNTKMFAREISNIQQPFKDIRQTLPTDETTSRRKCQRHIRFIYYLFPYTR